MIINDFVTALQNKDHAALAACFTADCRLFDYCPALTNRENSFLYGRNSIDMFFHNKFMFGGFGIMAAHVVNEQTADFYVSYNGALVHALAEIESCSSDDSLIQELVIRPA